MSKNHQDQMREEFEEWAKERGYQRDELARCRIGIVSPEYFNLNTENTWRAWQAACTKKAEQLSTAQKDAARWNALSPAARSVLSERERQINAEGWTAETDDAYNRGVLSDAGASYALHAYNSQRSNEVPEDWPWSEEWWKPSESARRNLEKAGALILAEIESFDRVSAISKS